MLGIEMDGNRIDNSNDLEEGGVGEEGLSNECAHVVCFDESVGAKTKSSEEKNDEGDELLKKSSDGGNQGIEEQILHDIQVSDDQFGSENNFSVQQWDAKNISRVENIGEGNKFSETPDIHSTLGEEQQIDLLGHSSVSEGSISKDWGVISSPRRGLDHCITAPVGTMGTCRNSLVDSHKIRSKTQKDCPRLDLKLDRLSDREKKKLIESLVKIQKDGTVEVDLAKSEPVASELLELRDVERGIVNADDMGCMTLDFNKTIPKLKIAILVVGTRGDVQPFLAVAKRLQEFGHHVRLATHTNFSDFVKSAGVEFYPLGGDPRVLSGYMARNKGFIPSSPGEISTQRKQLKSVIQSLLPACTEPDMVTGASFRAQAIIANPPAYGLLLVDFGLLPKLTYYMALASGVIYLGYTLILCTMYLMTGGEVPCCQNNYKRTSKLEKGFQSHIQWAIDFHFNSSIYLLAAGHAHVAEALGVPLHIFFTMPWTPTYEFPHPLARVPQSAGYWLSYIVVDLLIWWSIRTYVNDFRKRKLKLAPIAYFSMYYGSISHLPTGYMWSPHVVPKPKDWGTLVDVVGYCFLNLGSNYQPRAEFVEWIAKGPKPIYIGFGSMPLEDPRKTTGIILEALKVTEQRGILDRGWGDLGVLSEVPDHIYLLENCPHDWLFPQCCAVVHHGGAGTTATGLKAGCPTTVIPFFGDQFFWGDRIHQKGLGPEPIPISQLSAEALSDAIRFMLQPEVKYRATEIAKLIESEDGVAAAVDAFHRHLPPELPLPSTSLQEDDDHSSLLQQFFIQIGRLCCLPCS